MRFLKPELWRGPGLCHHCHRKERGRGGLPPRCRGPGSRQDAPHTGTPQAGCTAQAYPTQEPARPRSTPETGGLSRRAPPTPRGLRPLPVTRAGSPGALSTSSMPLVTWLQQSPGHTDPSHTWRTWDLGNGHPAHLGSEMGTLFPCDLRGGAPAHLEPGGGAQLPGAWGWGPRLGPGNQRCSSPHHTLPGSPENPLVGLAWPPSRHHGAA